MWPPSPATLPITIELACPPTPVHLRRLDVRSLLHPDLRHVRIGVVGELHLRIQVGEARRRRPELLGVDEIDLRQVAGNWIFRSWIIAMTLAAFGYMSFKMGIHDEAKIIQNAAEVMHDLLRWIVLGSVALVAALTVGAISSERGTLADSILSRFRSPASVTIVYIRCRANGSTSAG